MYANCQAAPYAVGAADYVIADYLRISKEYDARDESNSINNQRAMIKKTSGL